MDFTAAIAAMKSGKAVTRPSMLGLSSIYQVDTLTVNGVEATNVPFYAVKINAPGVVAWAPTQADMQATDWALAD